MSAAHAITPSDTRDPPRPAQHPANVASREHSAQVMNLALQIADREVRPMIEAYADDGELDAANVAWMNIQTSGAGHEEKASLDRAVRYIGVRSPDAFPWRFVRHPERPELVRFEDVL